MTGHGPASWSSPGAPRRPGSACCSGRTTWADGPRCRCSWIREAAGERWARLEINFALFGVDPEYHRRTGPPPPRGHDISEPDVPFSPHYLVGDPDEMADALVERRERLGISYVAMRPEHLGGAAEVVRRLAGDGSAER